MIPHRAVLFLACPLALAAAALAQSLTPTTHLPGDTSIALAAAAQDGPVIAAGGSGYLAVWMDQRTSFGGTQGDRDLYALRLDANGQPLDATPIPIAVTFGYQRDPKVSWNGHSWLVVWENQTPGTFFDAHAFGARVSTAGVVLDDPPLDIIGYDSSSSLDLDVTALGSEWLVVATGNSGTGNEAAIQGRRVDASGAFVDATPVVLAPATTQLFFRTTIESAGGEYLLAYDKSGLAARRFQSDLTPIGGPFSIPGTKFASNGTDYLVAYTSGGNLVASRMLTNGTLLDAPGVPIAPSSGLLGDPQPAWDGTHWWVGWDQALDGFLFARLDASANVLDPGGFAFDTVLEDEMSELALAANTAGIAIAWTDRRVTGVAPDDVWGARIQSPTNIGPQVPLSTGAPAQTAPDVAGGAGQFVIAYQSEHSGARRVLVQRANEAGQPIDPAPLELAASATLSSPDVAWNGSVYLVTWSDQTIIWGRRLDAALNVLDATPFAIMDGITPDAEALGQVFLVTGTHAPGSPQFRFVYSMRVDGATGALLDAAPAPIGNNYARFPQVTAFGGRWLVAFQRNFSHDDQNSEIALLFVEPDGTTAGQLPTFIQGGLPTIATGTNVALLAWRTGSPASGYPNVHGMRLDAAGNLLDNFLFGFTIASGQTQQLAPAVSFDGTNFVASWEDRREQEAFFDSRGDLYTAVIGEDGSVTPPGGAPLANGPDPEIQVALASSNGKTLHVFADFVPGPDLCAYRIGMRAQGPDCPGPTSYCATSPNSAGAGALIGSSGSVSILANDLVLEATGAAPSQPGLFYYGSAQIQVPFGDGLRCVGPGTTGTFRLAPVLFASPTGAFTRAIDFTAPPTGSGPGQVLAGSTWNFQLWYRDPAAGGSGFNLSDGLSATFCR